MNLWTTIFFLYRLGGQDTVRRFLTPPQSLIEKIRAKGTSMPGILEERGEAVEEVVEFVEAVFDPSFVDPDEPTP